MFKRLVNSLFVLLGFLLIHGEFIAQGCVQCRSQIESSQNNELTVGNGINKGITILMLSPYILIVLAIAFVFGNSKIRNFFKELIGLWK